MTKTRWQAYQDEEQAKYAAVLDQFDPERIGMRIICPGCGADSWLKLPEKRYAYTPLTIACPRACGAYGPFESFQPSAWSREDIGDFDLEHECGREGTNFATNGVVFRCPTCGIENAREVMRDLRRLIDHGLAANASSDQCADMLARAMSTFDGVMRASNKVAVANARELGKSHPLVRSFQSVAVARSALLPWDMAIAAGDWSRFVLIVHKRHLFAHTLGVVDRDYLAKSGDTTTQVGKRASLSRDDVVFFADAAEKIVIEYFGHFLS